AAAGLALDRNDETMFVGDALHHGEPDPGALRARREERVEELLALPLVDARPMIGDGELHALVRVQDDANHHFLAGPTRLYGIPHQVPDELAELSAVRANTDGGFPRVAHGHVGDGPPRAGRELDQLAREARDIDGREERLSRAREVDHVGHEIVQAARLPLYDVTQTPILLRELRRRAQE